MRARGRAGALLVAGGAYGDREPLEPTGGTHLECLGHRRRPLPDGEGVCVLGDYLRDGIPAVLRGVEQARSVLQIEAARQCARTGRPLDAALLKEAIRQSDLLLVHYADSSQLVSSTTA